MSWGSRLRSKGYLSFLSLFCFFAYTDISFAGGPVHGAKAAGMGTAFVGVSDDPSANLYNPAGLTQTTGTDLYFGATGINIETTYESPAGQTEKSDPHIFYSPHVFLTSDLVHQDFRMGIGLYTPFGIGGRSWSPTGTNRYASTRSMTATYSVNPNFAWRVLPGLSVAVGADYMYADIEMERMVNQSAVGASDAASSMKADGHGWGYNIGLLISPSPILNIGLAYRSGIRVDYEGDLTIGNIAPALQPVFGSSAYTTGARTAAKFPEIYSLGVGLKLSDKLVVDSDVELVRWSSFKKMELDIINEVPAAGLVDTSIPMNWKDSWQFKLGLDYKIDGHFSIRTGYAWVPTAVPDETLEPGNPDANQHNFSIGTGYSKSSLTLDLFYNIGIFEKRTVNNAFTSGSYENRMYYVGISIGYKL
jgi:long-chain fatty acid transport protein